DWLRLVFEGGNLAAIGEDGAARALIRDRERYLKGARARLENPRALAAWSGSSGSYRLSFRWKEVKKIIADILAGLNRGQQHA
ncbi:MAG TPA: DUF6361 family protein, partial [Bacillota bacterium]|nr:DUF6361 family protein [Bacillota bacterium]